MKKLIILDLDNTFYDYEDAHQKGIQAVFSNQNVFKNYDLFYSNYESSKNTVQKLNQDNPSKHSKLIYLKNLFFDKLEIFEIINLENIYWSSFISNAKLQTTAISLLRDNKEINDKFVLLTNQNLYVQLRKINEWNLNFFDYVVTSEEVGFEKPNPKFFNYVKSNVLNFHNTDYVTYAIGDDFKNDILFWVKNFGATGYLIDNTSIESTSDESENVYSLNKAVTEIYNNKH